MKLLIQQLMLAALAMGLYACQLQSDSFAPTPRTHLLSPENSPILLTGLDLAKASHPVQRNTENLFQKVYLKEALAHHDVSSGANVYAFYALAPSHQLRNLVVQEINGHFWGYWQTYEPQPEWLAKQNGRWDWPTFTGTISYESLDGKALGQVLVGATRPSNNSRMSDMVCVTVTWEVTVSSIAGSSTHYDYTTDCFTNIGGTTYLGTGPGNNDSSKKSTPTTGGGAPPSPYTGTPINDGSELYDLNGIKGQLCASKIRFAPLTDDSEAYYGQISHLGWTAYPRDGRMVYTVNAEWPIVCVTIPSKWAADETQAAELFTHAFNATKPLLEVYLIHRASGRTPTAAEIQAETMRLLLNNLKTLMPEAVPSFRVMTAPCEGNIPMSYASYRC